MSLLPLVLIASLIGVTAPSPLIPSYSWEKQPGFSAEQPQDERATGVVYVLELMGDMALKEDALPEAESLYRRAKMLAAKLKELTQIVTARIQRGISVSSQRSAPCRDLS
jgi:hypothetical protein